MLHVDLDAFFASVELLDHPELVDKPVVVGHRSGRSVVTAANYVARRYGVNSAMPMALALRPLPRRHRAGAAHEPVPGLFPAGHGIFNDVTPLVEPLGIDEAFLDVAGARRIHGSPADIGALIRRRVEAETGLTCSVGAASTKFVAKLASGRAKPNGLLVIPADDTIAFLHPLPVGRCGASVQTTEQTLQRLGLKRIGDIANTPLAVLQGSIGGGGRTQAARPVLGRGTREWSASTARRRASATRSPSSTT